MGRQAAPLGIRIVRSPELIGLDYCLSLFKYNVSKFVTFTNFQETPTTDADQPGAKRSALGSLGVSKSS